MKDTDVYYPFLRIYEIAAIPFGFFTYSLFGYKKRESFKNSLF